MNLVSDNQKVVKLNKVTTAVEQVEPQATPEFHSEDGYEVDVLSQLKANIASLEVAQQKLSFMVKELSGVLAKKQI